MVIQKPWQVPEISGQLIFRDAVPCLLIRTEVARLMPCKMPLNRQHPGQRKR